MIEAFENWFLSIASSLRARGHAIEWQQTGQQTNKPSAYAQVETLSQLARVTVWSSGECDLEALDIKTGAQLVNAHHVFTDAARLRSELDAFVQQLEGTR